jgi:hypothetical protein
MRLMTFLKLVKLFVLPSESDPLPVTDTTGLTLEGDSGEEVAFWLLTSLCTIVKREVEVAL